MVESNNSASYYLKDYYHSLLEVEDSEQIHDLLTEIRNLRESNRVILDVFWSASRLVKNCDQEPAYTFLTDLLKTLETNLKESDSCP